MHSASSGLPVYVKNLIEKRLQVTQKNIDSQKRPSWKRDKRIYKTVLHPFAKSWGRASC